MNTVTAIIFSCAELHVHDLYKSQDHQSWGVIPWVSKSVGSVFLLISYIISAPWYNSNHVASKKKHQANIWLGENKLRWVVLSVLNYLSWHYWLAAPFGLVRMVGTDSNCDISVRIMTQLFMWTDEVNVPCFWSFSPHQKLRLCYIRTGTGIITLTRYLYTIAWPGLGQMFHPGTVLMFLQHG